MHNLRNVPGSRGVNDWVRLIHGRAHVDVTRSRAIEQWHISATASSRRPLVLGDNPSTQQTLKAVYDEGVARKVPLVGRSAERPDRSGPVLRDSVQPSSRVSDASLRGPKRKNPRAAGGRLRGFEMR
jgi:hypothetical protein